MNANQQSIAMQPNFSKDQAAQFEQPAPGWKPRVQGRKFAFLKRKPTMQWRHQKIRRNVPAKIPLQQLRQKGNAIGEMHPSLREKKRSSAWTVDVSDCLFVKKESTGHKLKRKAKALVQKVAHPSSSSKQQHEAAPLDSGRSMFSGAQAAQFEQPAPGWKPRVQGRKFAFLKRKPTMQWRHQKIRRDVPAKISLQQLRSQRVNAGGALPPLVEKKRGVAWTVDVNDCLFKRKAAKEAMGHKLKRKAAEFVSAVKHIGSKKEEKPVAPAKHVRPEEQAIRKEHLTG